MSNEYFLDFELDPHGKIKAACACPTCDRLGAIQPGHFACRLSPRFLVEAGDQRAIFRAYEDQQWYWYVPASDRS